jgi:hypothetical protein
VVLFVFAHDYGPAVALAVVGAALFVGARGNRWTLPGRKAIGIEFGVMAFFYGVYELGRFLSRPSASEALANAHRTVSFERSLGIFREGAFQQLVIGHTDLEGVLNLTYSHGFLAFCMAVLAWTYVAHHEKYRLLRNAMAVSALLSVVTSAAFPLAPPRLTPGLGIVDTVVNGGGTHRLANAYAAMPSLHVGWMVLSGIVLAMCLPRKVGLPIALLPGGIMLVVVICTGNHYWVDGAVGTLYSLGGIAVGEAVSRWWPRLSWDGSLANALRHDGHRRRPSSATSHSRE